MTQASSIYDFTVLDAKKQPYDMKQLEGKVALIYNVASQCGLTNAGYTAATAMHNKYKDQGLVVLGFPCNQFGGQEPGTEEEIQHFACTKFKAEFPIMAKVDVNGEKAAPLFQYMKKAAPGILGTEGIKWNFTSFLVDRSGKVVYRFSPGEGADNIEKRLAPLI
jgi:glutathione peroxidase-type tryparedoxin peroxidase